MITFVDDFSIYDDKKVVLFYLYMSDFKNLDLDHINLLSRIVKENSDIEFITIVIDEDSSSTSYSVYKKYNRDIGGLVVSSKSNLPKDTFSNINAFLKKNVEVSLNLIMLVPLARVIFKVGFLSLDINDTLLGWITRFSNAI